MTPSQMLLETFDSLMVILVKLDQRVSKLEGKYIPPTEHLVIKEDIAYTKTLIGVYYGACKAAEQAKPYVPGIPGCPTAWLSGEDVRRDTYRRCPEER